MKEREARKKRQRGRKKGGQPHMRLGVCLHSAHRKARQQKLHTNTHIQEKHTHIDTHAHIAEAIAVATEDPSAVCYEK